MGDEVCALLAGGGYAELVAVPAGQLLPVPRGVGLEQAAALPEVAATVWSNVFDLAGLLPGEVLLVHGGGSGIGTMAVQLAARHGATVVVTVGSAAKAARCLELGATAAVNYREEDFVERVRTLTGGHGADVVLDVMGASYLGRNVEVLATGGRLVVIGLQGGTRGGARPGRPAGQAGVGGRHLAAVPAAGGQGADRRGGAGRGLAGARGRLGTAGRRPGATPVRGRRGAPRGGGERARRQGAAAGPLRPAQAVARRPTASRNRSTSPAVV